MMKSLGLVLLLTFTLFSQAFGYLQSQLASLTVCQTTEEDESLQTGEKFLATGDWAKAESHFKAATERQPDNPLWHVYLAVALDKQGKSGQVHVEMRKLIETRKIESLLVFLEKTKNGKIVFVDTRAFGDEQAGIKRYVAALKIIKKELEGKDYDWIFMDSKIKALDSDLANTPPTQDPKVTQAKQEEVRRLRREREQKKKDASIASEKRFKEVVGKVSQDIGNALENYAKKHGIAFILDNSKFLNARFLTDKTLDVTQDFIATYNMHYPE